MGDSTPEVERELARLYDLIEQGAFVEALADLVMVGEGLADDPVVQFLKGICLLELQRADEALDPLSRAVAYDGGDPEYRAAYGMALFRRCRFDEAWQAVEPVRESADGQFVRGLVLERRQEFDRADAAFARAAQLDPEQFQQPVRLSAEAFQQAVDEAAAQLPDAFRQHLENVPVRVEPLPSQAILTEDEPWFEGDELLGLFLGATIAERGRPFGDAGVDATTQILLFQRNLERACEDEQELREQIAVTLYHELGHYLGLDEDELEAIDLA